MSDNKKEFNTKLYGIVSFVAVAAILATLCVTTFKAKYTGFHPDELAKTYVDTIVQSGDGYNAYKNTLVSKSDKYGDFIRENYIYPAIYRNTQYKTGDDISAFEGYNNEKYMSDTTINDDGTLSGKLIDEMYPFYEKIVADYGWDNYDYIFSNYICKLIEVRSEIYGDDYLTDEIFFTAFEANVAMYAAKLTGTEDTFDENSGVQLTYKSEGIYEKKYGEDYKFTANTTATTDVDIETYKAAVDNELFKLYGVSADDISQVNICTVDVTDKNGNVVTSCDVTVVKIGIAWYVDNTATSTASLYNFYK